MLCTYALHIRIHGEEVGVEMRARMFAIPKVVITMWYGVDRKYDVWSGCGWTGNSQSDVKMFIFQLELELTCFCTMLNRRCCWIFPEEYVKSLCWCRMGVDMTSGCVPAKSSIACDWCAATNVGSCLHSLRNVLMILRYYWGWEYQH